MNAPYILTDDTLTLFDAGRPITLHRGTAGDMQWERALGALKEGDFEAIVRLADTASQLKSYTAGHGDFKVEDGRLMYKGEMLDSYPARKAVQLMREGLPFEPLLNFIERLERNPSRRAVQDLYGFLEHGLMPLTPDGCFLAYKKVARTAEGNFVDVHSRSFDNNVGTVVEMPRNRVDEDPDRTCSHGLHVCSFGYLPFFGGHSWDEVVVCKVDPADVVAIPRDYDNTKMRVCRYEVTGTVDREQFAHLWADRLVVDDYEWHDWDGAEDMPEGVGPKDTVEARYRDGDINIRPANEFVWDHFGLDNDIVAYRIVERADEGEDEEDEFPRY